MLSVGRRRAPAHQHRVRHQFLKSPRRRHDSRPFGLMDSHNMEYKEYRINPGTLRAMTGKVLSITLEEIQAGLKNAPPPTADDVSLTLDGRRLDSKEAVLAWLADVEADIAAGRLVTLDDGSQV